MQASAPPRKTVSPSARSFLDYCRVEKGLAANSLASYHIDLQKLNTGLKVSCPEATSEDLGRYVQDLHQQGLAPRTVARHVATMRNFYGFLAREGVIPK